MPKRKSQATKKDPTKPKSKTTAKTKSPPRPEQRIQAIREALEELRLHAMREVLDQWLAPGGGGESSDESRLDFLWHLLEPQLRTRKERAIERRIRAARFPAIKTLDGFDFDFQPNLDRDRIFILAALDFIRLGQNILFGGMSGTGKSHLAMALGYLACAEGFRVRYTTNANMLADLHASRASDDLDRALRPFLRCDLLIIDEVGLDLPERADVNDAQLFYKVVGPRYNAPRSTIITSNIDWELWGEHLGDDIATVAILDRLIHHGHAISIDGPSYRAHKHQELNPKSKSPRGTKPRSKPRSRN